MTKTFLEVEKIQDLVDEAQKIYFFADEEQSEEGEIKQEEEDRKGGKTDA